MGTTTSTPMACDVNMTYLVAVPPRPQFAHVTLTRMLTGPQTAPPSARTLAMMQMHARPPPHTTLDSQQLCVILDLDETLVSSTFYFSGDMENVPDGLFASIGAEHAVVSFPPDRQAVIFLRPWLREFIAKLHQFAELHLCTLGSREYAIKVLDIIDPMGIYFGDRILTRTELGSGGPGTPDTMPLKRIDLHAIRGRQFLIVDDMPSAWDPDVVPQSRILAINQWRVFAHSDTHHEGMTDKMEAACEHAWIRDELSSPNKDGSLQRIYHKIQRAHQIAISGVLATSDIGYAIDHIMSTIPKVVNICVPETITTVFGFHGGCFVLNSRYRQWWDVVMREIHRTKVTLTHTITPLTTHVVMCGVVDFEIPPWVQRVDPGWLFVLLESGLHKT